MLLLIAGNRYPWSGNEYHFLEEGGDGWGRVEKVCELM